MHEDLLKRLRERDKTALAEVTQLHGPAMARAAYLFLRDAHAAEDVTQEALLAAWDASARTSPETPLRGWLFGILFNQCRKHQRSLWRRLRRERLAGSERAVANASNGGHPDYLDGLAIALASLDEEHRVVVIMRYQQGLSTAQTAEALAIPEGTVKSRSHVALERLREHMRKHNE